MANLTVAERAALILTEARKLRVPPPTDLGEALYTLAEADILHLTPEEAKLVVQVYQMCVSRRFTHDMRL